MAQASMAADSFAVDARANQRSRTRSGSARDRILDVGERLFMARGYEATSMRLVTEEAGVNLAAVNYYFGSKESFMEAVFNRRMEWLNAERLRLLDAMEQEAGGRPLRPSKIVEAFFGTLLAIGEDDSLGGVVFLKLLGRTLNEPAEFMRVYFEDGYTQVIERYRTALSRALPDLAEEEIAWRFNFMLGATSCAIAGIGNSSGDGAKTSIDGDPAMLRKRLMPFLLGGLRAEFSTIGAKDRRR